LSDYDWGPYPIGKIGLYGLFNSRNAALSLQLVNEFLKWKSNEEDIVEHSNHHQGWFTAKTFNLSKQDALGLRLCNWPGEKVPSFTFNIDFSK